MNKNPIIVLMALLSALLFGASTPASKWLLDSISPFVLAGLLYIGASIGVLPVLIRDRALSLPTKLPNKTKSLLLGAILSGGILGPVLLLMGLSLASSASVSLWLNLELVATVTLGVIFFKEHISFHSVLAAIGTVIASVLLSITGGTSGIFAGLLVLGACIAWGFDNHFTSLIDGITPSQSTFWKGLVAGTVNLSIGLYLDSSLISLSSFGYALLIGIFAYGASIVLYIGSAQQLGATRSQIIFSTSPFWGVALSALLLGESISTTQLVAAGIMCGSLILLFFETHAHEHIHYDMEHEHWHKHTDDHHTHDHDSETTENRNWHSHRHTHEGISHAHVHLPDLHHRHGHN